jgi:hypothetical protein
MQKNLHQIYRSSVLKIFARFSEKRYVLNRCKRIGGYPTEDLAVPEPFMGPGEISLDSSPNKAY